MELLEGIKSRRTVRKFKEKEVEKKVINKVIETASYAPSWKNSQTVSYLVVLNREKICKIADEATMSFTWNQNIIQKAPVLIAVLTEEGKSGYEKDGSFSTSKGTHWQSFDAGIAAQTVCLAAHAEGLGSVIMGIYDEEKVKEILSMEKGKSVSALIAMGYPNQEPNIPERKTVNQITRFVE